MSDNSKNTQAAHACQPDPTHGIRGIGSRIAPAVALLMMGDAVSADSEDGSDDTFSVAEPSTLGLLVAGAAAGSMAAYVRRRRRK